MTKIIKITPAMLRMSARDPNWMFCADVMKKQREGQELDEIAREILEKDKSE